MVTELQRRGGQGGNEKSDYAEPIKTLEEVVQFACEQQESEITRLARECTTLGRGYCEKTKMIALRKCVDSGEK